MSHVWELGGLHSVLPEPQCLGAARALQSERVKTSPSFACSSLPELGGQGL